MLNKHNLSCLSTLLAFYLIFSSVRLNCETFELKNEEILSEVIVILFEKGF